MTSNPSLERIILRLCEAFSAFEHTHRNAANPFGPHSVTVGVAIGHRRDGRSEELLLDAGLHSVRHSASLT